MARSGHVRLVTAVLLAGLVLLTLPASATAGEKGKSTPGVSNSFKLKDRTSLTVAFTALAENFAPVLLAKQLGEFEKQNLDVSFTTINDPSSIYSLLQQSKLDANMIGLQAGFFNFANTGGNLYYVSGGVGASAPDADVGWYMRKDLVQGNAKASSKKPLKSCPLEGQKIGMFAGGVANAASVSLANWLATCKLSLSDVELVTISSSAMPTALETGAIAAGPISSTTVGPVKEKGAAVYSNVSFSPSEGSGGILMGPSLLNNKRVAKAFLQAILNASNKYLIGKDYHSDPQVISALAAVSGNPQTTFTAAPAQVFAKDLAFNEAGAHEIQKFWTKQSGILQYPTPLPLKKYHDGSLMEDVVAASNPQSSS